MRLTTSLFAFALALLISGCDAVAPESAQGPMANLSTCHAPELVAVTSQSYTNKIRIAGEKGQTDGTSATWSGVQYRLTGTTTWRSDGITHSPGQLYVDVHGFRLPTGSENGTSYQFRARQTCYDTSTDPFGSMVSGYSNAVSASVIFQGTGA